MSQEIEYDFLSIEGKIWCNTVSEYKEWDGGPSTASHWIKVDSAEIDYFGGRCTLLRSDREDMTDWYPYGFLIERDQRVFYMPTLSQRRLLYDFGAEKGDTVTVYNDARMLFQNHPTESTYRVDSIDMIYIRGVERKRILLTTIRSSFHDGGERETWISGIGSLSGLLFNSNCHIGCDAAWLSCLNIGDSLLYPEWDRTNCFYSHFVGMPEASHLNSLIKIYPNPAGDIITIESEISDRYSIDIASLNGQLIHSSVMEGTEHQIDLSFRRRGIYFITIRSKDFVTTRKIIKL